MLQHGKWKLLALQLSSVYALGKKRNPQEPQALGVNVPANFPFLISTLRFKIRNFPNAVPNHNVSPFSAVTGKVNQRSINDSSLSPKQAAFLLWLRVRKRMSIACPPRPGMPLNDKSLTLDFEFRELKPQILTKQTYHTQVMVGPCQLVCLPLT